MLSCLLRRWHSSRVRSPQVAPPATPVCPSPLMLISAYADDFFSRTLVCWAESARHACYSWKSGLVSTYGRMRLSRM
ncbi:hypothetical protein LZ32DRAFT_24932 [Colletotrichum eremochloae]|nr:hypothetical protein LZ32DRAFT_24932 [Colletotrichum eremochloae]